MPTDPATFVQFANPCKDVMSMWSSRMPEHGTSGMHVNTPAVSARPRMFVKETLRMVGHPTGASDCGLQGAAPGTRHSTAATSAALASMQLPWAEAGAGGGGT